MKSVVMQHVIDQLKQLSLIEIEQQQTLDHLERVQKQMQTVYQPVGQVALIPSKITSMDVLLHLGGDILAEMPIVKAQEVIKNKLKNTQLQILQLRSLYLPEDIMELDDKEEIEGQIQTFIREQETSQFNRFIIPQQNENSVVVRHSQKINDPPKRKSKFGMMQ